MGPARRVVAVMAWCWTAALVGVAGACGSVFAAEPPAPATVAEPGRLEPLPPAPLLLEQVMRGLLEAAPGRETLDEVMQRAWSRNREAAAAAQRREFIRQQTQHFEKMLQPLLDVELAFVKRTCGSLAPEARRRVLAAARQAVHDVAERQVRLQFEPDAAAAETLDLRRVIHERVLAALEPLAAPDEVAAYVRESRLRHERREEVARIRIVAVLDEQIGLSTGQRTAVLDDLRANWQAAWICELDDSGGQNGNGQPLAPDFAAASIVPHLDAAQSRRWQQWTAAASWQAGPRQGEWSELNMLSPHMLAPHGQPGQPKPDAWWQP